MEVDRLVVALRQALDEEERIARATVPSPWSVSASGMHVQGEDLTVMENLDNPGPWHQALPHHIARHDPARVLRQVAAHRAILDRHEPSPWVRDLPYCLWCSDKRGDSIEDWPCPDFLALVEIYGVSTAREAQVTDGA